MAINYYVVLGISSDSTQNEIRAAYRKLAKEFHPDHFGKKSSPFLTIQEAYSVLSDAEKRKKYDTSIGINPRKQKAEMQVQQRAGSRLRVIEPLIPDRQRGGFNRTTFSPSSRFTSSFHGSAFDEILHEILPGNPNHKQTSENLSATITLTREQARLGGYIRLQVPIMSRCIRCGGYGAVGPYSCRQCNGVGATQIQYPLLVSYPPGVSDNHIVTIPLQHYGDTPINVSVKFEVAPF